MGRIDFDNFFFMLIPVGSNRFHAKKTEPLKNKDSAMTKIPW